MNRLPYRPSTEEPIKVGVFINLTDDLIDALDDEAERLGVSRSRLIRSILDQFLRKQARKRAKSIPYEA